MKTLKKIGITIGMSLCSLIILGGIAFGYLKFVPPAESITVDRTESEIPYEKLPDDVIVCCRLFNGDTLCFSLSFSKSTLTVFGPWSLQNPPKADYVCVLDRATVTELIDRAGGLELTRENCRLRLAGVQAADRLEQPLSPTEHRQVTGEFCRQIARYGLDMDDLSFLFQYATPQPADETIESWVAHLPAVFSTAEIQ